MLQLILLPPITRGLWALLLSSFLLPAGGIPIIEEGLFSLRFMLMHGALLGGTLALIMGIPILPVMIVVNALLMVALSRRKLQGGAQMGRSATLYMVLTMGLASLLTRQFQIPGQEILALLWGSPFSLTPWETALFTLWTTVSVIAFLIFRKRLHLLLFDPEYGKTLGLNMDRLSLGLNLWLGITIALGIKLLGALLVDALLLMPAILVREHCRSGAQYFLTTLLSGVILATVGGFLTLAVDWPLSGSMALVGGAFILISTMKR